MKTRGKRALLNKSGFHSTAAIVAEVEDTRGWKAGCNGEGNPVQKENEYSGTPEVFLHISDCDRKVSFDFEFSTAAGRKNALYKLDTMIDCLVELRLAIEDEQQLYLERVKVGKTLPKPKK